MLVAKITVTGTQIRVEKLVPITSGMVGATVEVTFDESWDGYSKVYVWNYRNVTIDDLNATGTIPVEVLERAGGWLRFGVYGTKDDCALPTLWVTVGSVDPGADPSGDESADPALPVWAQLKADIEKLKQSGVSDERINGLIEDYMEANPVAHPTQVSAFKNDAGYLTEHQDLSGYATVTDLEPFAVLVNEDTSKTDRSAIEVLSAVASGKTVFLVLGSLTLPIYAIDQDAMVACFKFEAENAQIMFKLDGNQLSAEYTEYALKEDIPTDEHINNLIYTAIANSEERFLIGDVTTTEEVGVITFDTNIECKKLYANFIIPNDTTLNHACITFNCETDSVWGGYGNNTDKNICKRYYMECELIKGYGVKYYFASNGANKFHADLDSGSIILLNSELQSLTHFHIAANYGDHTFPAGARLTVWGVKQ